MKMSCCQDTPQGLNQLFPNSQLDWSKEKKLHCTKEYLTVRNHIINGFPSGKLITCYFCGFPDDKFLELHHLDGNHANFNPENLVLACSCCHRLHHLGWVAVHNLGKLVYIPGRKTDGSSKLTDNENQQKLDFSPLAMINLIQFYKMLETFVPANIRENEFKKTSLGGLFDQTRILLGSSGVNNNYVKQQKYEQLKKLLVKKQQDLKNLSESESQAASDFEEQYAAHSFVQNDLQDEVSDLEKQIDEFEKEIISVQNAKNSQQLDEISKKIEDRLKRDFQSFAADSMHLLDLLEALDALNEENKGKEKQSSGESNSTVNTDNTNNDSPMVQFFNTQKENIKNKKGFFTIEYNPKILEPFSPYLGYTLKQRLRFYFQELAIIDPSLASKQNKNKEDVPSIANLMKRTSGKIYPVENHQEIIKQVVDKLVKQGVLSDCLV